MRLVLLLLINIYRLNLLQNYNLIFKKKYYLVFEKFNNNKKFNYLK